MARTNFEQSNWANRNKKERERGRSIDRELERAKPVLVVLLKTQVVHIYQNIFDIDGGNGKKLHVHAKSKHGEIAGTEGPAHTHTEKIERLQDEGDVSSPSGADVVGAPEMCKIFFPSQSMARGKVQQTIFIMENRRK